MLKFDYRRLFRGVGWVLLLIALFSGFVCIFFLVFESHIAFLIVMGAALIFCLGSLAWELGGKD